ncbi:hypothetical protein ACHWQZ_G008428 [Mnemiopsis leidyi]
MDISVYHQMQNDSSYSSDESYPARQKYHHNSSFDSALGSFLLTLSLLGTLFNLIVVLAVRTVTKKNCSKARLASSLLIFNLSLSDTVYSTVHLFSAVTMLSGGRDPDGGGIPDNLPITILCNLTGVFFNLTMRTSLWFLTMLTVVRYISVMFPLKLPLLISKRRVKTLALSVWIAIFLLPLVPFLLKCSYTYSPHLSICIWHIAYDQIQNFHTRVAIHLLLMVMPIVLPGILIITLYLQIVWKVIQLKTVHYKLRSGKIADKEEKVEDEEEELVAAEDKDLVEKNPSHHVSIPVSGSTSNSKRKKISLAISSWSSSISFLNRPLSIVELERIEKETECIDQDLMNYAVTSLSKDTFNNQSTHDRAGVVAYYINRFIVKTAGSATFERIQSHSFTESRRSVDYEAEECPISLNYYDCKEFPDITSSSWSLRRGSEPPSLCDEAGAEQQDEQKVRMFRVEPETVQKQDFVNPPPRMDMASVVAQAMKKVLNKDLNDIKAMGNKPSTLKKRLSRNTPNPLEKSKSISGRSLSVSSDSATDNSASSNGNSPSPSTENGGKPIITRRVSSFREVADRCRSNSILEESTTTSSALLSPVPRIVCKNGVCREVSTVSEHRSGSFRVTESPSSTFGITSSIKEEDPQKDSAPPASGNAESNHENSHQPVTKATSLPEKLVCKEIAPPQSFPVERKFTRRTQSSPGVIGTNPPDGVAKTKRSLKSKILSHLRDTANKSKGPTILQEKRINRLDMRLRVIIQSAFYTLLMVTLFVICYMPWWLLSIDILVRLIGKSPMIDVDFTWYCNFLTISYSTILLSACSNPVIYFYFAYKQAMLDTLKLKYKRFSKGKLIFLKSRKKAGIMKGRK